MTIAMMRRRELFITGSLGFVGIRPHQRIAKSESVMLDGPIVVVHIDPQMTPNGGSAQRGWALRIDGCRAQLRWAESPSLVFALRYLPETD